MITLDDVSWTYPHAEAPTLHRLRLAVAPGELVVLCGASGSGKSTTLRLMNGLIPHFHDDGHLTGTVTVNGLGTAGAGLDAIGLVTGTVLQHPRRQFFTDTAREEVAFALENFGFPPEDIRARVNRTLADLSTGLSGQQRLSQLSGGQQQQVALAAATAHHPAVMLLDEPSSNLSADAVDRLVTTLAELKARGVTIVVAEHRLRYLQELLDRVVVMRDGRIDREWSAAQFRQVSDAELAREGLRGNLHTAVLPPVPASGGSAAEPTDESDRTSGSHSGGRGLLLEGIHCRLGGRTVLDLHRVVLAAGQVTAVRGVNGAGKSTLARVITGLQRSNGVVRLDGRPLGRSARQRASAIVMQDVQRQLFTDSVNAEIELAARDAPNTPSVTALLEALDLTAYAGRHPLALSGGQQQRLVVAAAGVTHRQIVVFDEPSSGVDRRHLRSIADQIRQTATAGAVVLLISHDQDLLALAADRQLALRPLTESSVRDPILKHDSHFH